MFKLEKMKGFTLQFDSHWNEFYIINYNQDQHWIIDTLGRIWSYNEDNLEKLIHSLFDNEDDSCMPNEGEIEQVAKSIIKMEKEEK